MRLPVRSRPVLAVLVGAAVLGGCGGSEGGTACSDTVCTVQSDGPGTYDLDQLGTEVEVSDLRSDAVRVRINSETRDVRRDAAPARIRGYLVTAEETGPDRVKVRIER